MGMEYAGAVELDPPLDPEEASWVLDVGWTVAADRRVIRPSAATRLDDCVDGLRDLVELDVGLRRYDGAVAAYDARSGELVLVSTRAGRVTRRTLRKARGPVGRDNVIDLAGRRRALGRAVER
jgi:hypothetical protein